MVKLMAANFKHKDLRLVNPPFESKLNTLILELDYLRKKPLSGTTHLNRNMTY